MMAISNKDPGRNCKRRMMAARHNGALMVVLGCLLLASSSSAASDIRSLAALNTLNYTTYDLRVTLASASPDCYDRPVIMISVNGANGVLSPTLTVKQNDILQVTVHNDLPEDYPEIGGGITIHWHGFGLYDHTWYDGTAYVMQCPIIKKSSFTYSFKVTEAPGTYWWHDHANEHTSDGLRGALIVTPADGTPQPWKYDAEHIMLLADWYHEIAPATVIGLNRPFDAAKQTNDTGHWAWAGNPQTVLVNGKAYYQDCKLFPNGGSSTNTLPPLCNVTVLTVPPGQSAIQPWQSPTSPGCTHDTLQVVPGKTYRLRLINAGSLLALIVCWEGHNVTVITSGVTPLEPYNTTCLPINIGERYDVLLTANQKPGNYWVSVQGAFRLGAPSGFSILSYVSPNITVALPATPTPQGNQTWPSVNVTKATMVTNRDLLGSNGSTVFGPSFFPLYANTLTPPQTSDRSIVFNLTQPLIKANGMLRWAMNNIAAPLTTQCNAVAALIQKNPLWVTQHTVNASIYNATQSVLAVTVGTGKGVGVYTDSLPAQTVPAIGLHIVEVFSGQVIDMIINDLPANALGGDYRPAGVNRTTSEQHPMHLHGHRFWVLGYNGSSGPYNATRDQSSLNLVNPPYVDTWTALPNGWIYLRFVADNPGMWPIHCHIGWHAFMGQRVYIMESKALWKAQPKGFPTCPSPCDFDFAPFTVPYVKKTFGDSGFVVNP